MDALGQLPETPDFVREIQKRRLKFSVNRLSLLGLDEVADASRVDKKKLGQCYRLLLRSLNIKIPLSNPIDYIARFASQLELSSPVQLRTVEILNSGKVAGNLQR